MATTHPTHRKPSTATTPWLLVTAVIAGALLLGIGLIVGGVGGAVVMIVGALLVVAGAVAAFALPGRKLSGPISFGAEFPDHTVGPRATRDGHSGPPIDTDPSQAGKPRPPYPLIGEIDPVTAASLPDAGRVLPQHVNLGPGERLRLIGGVPVVELEDHLAPEVFVDPKTLVEHHKPPEPWDAARAPEKPPMAPEPPAPGEAEEPDPAREA